MENNKLKIGLILDSIVQPIWVADLIRRINSSDVGIITHIIKPIYSEPTKKRSLLTRVLSLERTINTIFFQALIALERIFFLNKDDTNLVFGTENISELLRNAVVHELSVTGKLGVGSHSATDKSEIEKIDCLGLDLIIRRGLNIIRGDILTVAKYGIWSFHHGNHDNYRGGPPGFWEVYHLEPYSGYVIQKLGEKLDDGLIIKKGAIETEKTWLRNFSKLVEKANFSFEDAIKQLYVHRSIDSIRPPSSTISFYTSPLYKRPEAKDTIVYCSRILMRWILSKIFKAKSKRVDWTIGYGKLLDGKMTAYNSKSISKPLGTFNADPFVFSYCNKKYIFFEAYSFQKSKGHIEYVEIFDDLTHSIPRLAISQHYHMSYPYIFIYNDKVYMLPETSECRRLEIWEAVNFPSEWRLCRVIFEDEDIVDSSIFYFENSWWLTTNKNRLSSTVSYDLYFYKTDDPIHGEWIPHTMNPVCTDSSVSRNAGFFAASSTELYRCSQSKIHSIYGRSLKINQIFELSLDEYIEKNIGEYKPDFISKKSNSRLHHLSISNDIFAFDYSNS